MAFHSNLPIEAGKVQLFHLENAEALVCEKLLRHIPHKRWVCLGHWGEQIVVAKLFAQQRHAQTELNGINHLSDANILAPTVLYHGWVREKSLYVIVYEHIPYKQNLDEIWQTGTEVKRIDLIQKLVTVIAQLHRAGLQQLDLHPQNFLFHEDKIYVLDAAEIVQTKDKKILSKYSNLKNLGALLAQFPSYYDTFCEKFYLLYTQQSKSVFTALDIKQLKKWIFYWRKRRLIKFGNKAFRSCTQFICKKNWSNFSVCDRRYFSQPMQVVLKNPNEALNSINTEILKSGNSSTVGKIVVDGKFFVIKRYNLKNFWHALKRIWRISRAAKSWRHAQYLSLLDIATTKPVAMIEKRFGPFRLTSYFITEYIAANNLKNIVAITSPEQASIIAENIAKLFSDLDAVQLAHGDMKATNILVCNNKPILLDLDAMHLYRTHCRWQRAAKKDRKRFMKNWEYQPELLQLFDTIVNPD